MIYILNNIIFALHNLSEESRGICLALQQGYYHYNFMQI